MATTIQDIADELNLSLATVSRSLRHDPLIRPRTRARVNETALKLGYQPRVRPSKEPETKRSTIGFFIQFDPNSAISRYPNLMRMLEGVSAEADANNLLLVMHSVSWLDRGKIAEDPTRVPTMIRERTCEAMIVQGDHAIEDISFLAAQMPVVSLSWLYPGIPVSAAVQENARPVQKLVERLVSLGHRQLAWIASSHRSSFYDERQAGFVQGLLSQGLPLSEMTIFGREIYDGYWIRERQALVRAINAGVTAMVCANDELALMIIEILEESGFRVPDDVSVTGFDAAGQRACNGKELTTIDPHFVEMGRCAVRLVLQRLAYPAENPVFLVPQATFIPGETIGPARA